MTNEDFLGQIPAHPDAIQDDVEKDYGTDFSLELAVSDNDDSTWLPDLGVGGVYPALLGVIRARAADLKKQLDAIDAGAFPRAPDDITQDEACVDQQLDGPRLPACPDNCLYDGCASLYCDPNSGTCLQGMSDSKCEDVPDLQGYEGIESFEGSDQPAFSFKDPSSGALEFAVLPRREGRGQGHGSP